MGYRFLTAGLSNLAKWSTKPVGILPPRRRSGSRSQPASSRTLSRLPLYWQYTGVDNLKLFQWRTFPSVTWSVVCNSSSTAALAEQAAVFRESGRLLHCVPDTSCVVKPVKTQYIQTRPEIVPPHCKFCNQLIGCFDWTLIFWYHYFDIIIWDFFCAEHVHFAFKTCIYPIYLQSGP